MCIRDSRKIVLRYSVNRAPVVTEMVAVVFVTKWHYLSSVGSRFLQPVAPPGFCNRGEVRYGSIGGLEYEVTESRFYCLCINVALCSTACNVFVV